MGLAIEAEPGRRVVSDKAEATLKELGQRRDIIDTMHANRRPTLTPPIWS
jgi:hypothetical protein